MTRYTFSESISYHIADGNWGEIENYFNNSGFAGQLVINVVLVNPNQPKCEINDIQAFHSGGVGQDYINGAVLAGVFDLVIGLKALGYSSHGNMATSTVSVRFLKPVEKNRFYAVAKVSNTTGGRVFSEMTLYNWKDQPCGYATGDISLGIH